jgi:hypothetical protein
LTVILKLLLTICIIVTLDVAFRHCQRKLGGTECLTTFGELGNDGAEENVPFNKGKLIGIFKITHPIVGILAGFATRWTLPAVWQILVDNSICVWLDFLCAIRMGYFVTH